MDDDLQKINTKVPHPARVWNYLLGGKDHYAVDKAAAEQARETMPEVARLAGESRQFLNRAVGFLAGEAGIRQFLDIGTGLPTADNTHEVAQHYAPDARIVYVDNDKLVLAHARALLTSTAEGASAYIDADVRDPDVILEQAARRLNFDLPIGLMLMGIMEFIPDDDQAFEIVDRLVGALPSGSYLALYATTSEVHGERTKQAVEAWNQIPDISPMKIRTPERISRFFRGLELVEPGLVQIVEWRATHPDFVEPVDAYGAVARKP